ncbi:MAG: hypothetical protein HKN13_12535 [Rhodothermales bacterium]|nr:hypothetical protein [Rhodothermales bacterium]
MPDDDNSVELVQKRLTETRRSLARLHHDLQNPLSIMTGNIELVNALSEEVTVDPSIRQCLDDIDAASRQLIEILDRLNTVRLSLDV